MEWDSNWEWKAEGKVFPIINDVKINPQYVAYVTNIKEMPENCLVGDRKPFNFTVGMTGGQTLYFTFSRIGQAEAAKRVVEKYMV